MKNSANVLCNIWILPRTDQKTSGHKDAHVISMAQKQCQEYL